MKIKCQEHYDKVAEYAKSIGAQPFRIALNASNNGRRTLAAGMKLNCITISLRIHSDLRKGHRMEETALWVDCSITADRMSLLP